MSHRDWWAKCRRNSAMTLRTTPTTNQIALFGTIGFIALHLLFLLWAGPIYQNSDDSIYSMYAHLIERGTYQYNHDVNPSFQHRYAVSVPTALSYALFGINQYSLASWSWIYSLLTISILFNFTLRQFGATTAFIASLTFTTNTLQIGTALSLSVDIAVSFFMFLTAILLYKARQQTSKGREVFFAIAITASLILATLSKLTVIWIFPAILILLLVDLKNGHNRKLWLNIVGFGLFFGACYLIWMHIFTGSFYSRFSGTLDILRTPGQIPNANFNKMLNNIPARMTYEPLLAIMSTPGMLIPLVLALPSLALFFNNNGDQRKSIGYWWLCIFSILTYIWIGPTSFDPYIPLLLVKRYFLPLLPFLSIASGLAIAPIIDARLSQSQYKILFIWVLGNLFIMLPLLYFLAYFKLGLLIITIPVIFTLLWKRVVSALPIVKQFIHWGRWITVALLVATFVALPSKFILSNQIGEKPWQTAEREIIQNHFLVGNDPKTVYSNSRGISAITFYSGYQIPENLTLINWERIPEKISERHGRHYVYVNQITIKALSSSYNIKPPTFVTTPPAHWKPVAKRDGIILFTTQTIPQFTY